MTNQLNMEKTAQETLQVIIFPIQYHFDIVPNQDFGEGCTTHGIKYILERGQPFLDRFLWLIVVVAGVRL